jgi:hypothetical protein
MRMLEHQFTMITSQGNVSTVYRTSRISVLITPRQADRCYSLLRSGGDVWAWLIDLNRQRFDRGDAPIVSYQELCRELATRGNFGELSVAGARSVLRRYSDAWFEAAKRRRHGQHAGFPRRRRSLVPVRFYNGTFEVAGHRVRIQMAKGRPELWIRLSRPLCYPPEQVRAITLLHDAGRLWLAVTAAIPIQRNDLDPARVAGVDLGIIHPYAVAADQAALLISGRAIRAENYLHLKDLQARQARASRRIPNRGQQGSRRWRRYRYKQRQAEARHRRRVYQAHHQAAQTGGLVCSSAASRRPRRWRPERSSQSQRRPSAEPEAAPMASHPSHAGATRQERAGGHSRAPRGRARYILDLSGLSKASQQTGWAAVLLPQLFISRASRSGRCRQHRRLGRRESERGFSGARRAPSSRHRAGSA